MKELSDAERLLVSRARKLERFFTQPFLVTVDFTGLEGKWVSLQETIDDCSAILEGRYDDYPEEAFQFVGSIDDVEEKAQAMQETA